MKLFILMTVIIGVTMTAKLCSGEKSSSSDKDDFKDALTKVLAVIPFSKIVPIIKKQLSTNREAYDVFTFTRSGGLDKLKDIFKGIPTYNEASNELLSAGVDLDELFEAFQNFLDLDEFEISSPPKSTPKCCSGKKGADIFGNEILAALPTSELREVIGEEASNSSAFDVLLEQYPKLDSIIDDLRASKKYQQLFGPTSIDKMKFEIYAQEVLEILKGVVSPSEE